MDPQQQITETAAVVLAAGEGKRMRSALPKVLHELAGAPLLEWVLDTCAEAGLRQVHVVVGHHSEAVRRRFAGRDIIWVEQPERRGTADAVARALPQLGGPARVLILSGDVPLLRARTLVELAAAHTGGLSFLSTETDDPTGYGRVLREAGEVRAIVEHRDARPEQRAVREINAGIYLVDRALLEALLPQIGADNEQGEYYLTDLVGLALAEGLPVRALTVAPEEAAGVNSHAELAALSRPAQQRIQRALLEAGVSIDAPELTYIEQGARIEPGARIGPFSVIRNGAQVAAGCEVGPFSHLRAGAELRPGAEVGNFVEVKQSTLGEKTKAKHLAYIGDAQIGAGANIGAGTVFANYDGVAKHPTAVGDGAFIGSGTVLVAPVRVGARAVTGAGAVVTRNHDVAEGQTVVGVPARPLPNREQP